MDLLQEWAIWHEGAAPFVLEGDREILGPDRCKDVKVQNWATAHGASDFCSPKDSKVELGLLPQPFCGDIRRASIYLLLLNPALDPTDYFGEYERPDYREALLVNLRQKVVADTIPFVFLEPRFSWHGGFRWWHKKLAGIIERLALHRQTTFAAARAYLASRLASIELMPYHSASFRSGSLLRKLHSVALAKQYVQEVVVSRAIAGEAIAIVTRKVGEWNLPKHEKNIILYDGGEARAAHITPDSAGGQRILEHLE